MSIILTIFHLKIGWIFKLKKNVENEKKLGFLFFYIFQIRLLSKVIPIMPWNGLLTSCMYNNNIENNHPQFNMKQMDAFNFINQSQLWLALERRMEKIILNWSDLKKFLDQKILLGRWNYHHLMDFRLDSTETIWNWNHEL